MAIDNQNINQDDNPMQKDSPFWGRITELFVMSDYPKPTEPWSARSP